MEVKNYTNDKLEIAGSEITNTIKKQIEDLLFAFSKEKFEVIITKQQEIQIFKNQLISKVEASDAFKLVKKHFPDSTISDILLKN